MVNGKLDADLTKEEEDELAALYPAPIDFKVGDKVLFQLQAMDLEHCQRCVYAARPVVSKLMAGERSKAERIKTAASLNGPIGTAEISEIEEDSRQAVMMAVAEHRDETNTALAIATGKSRRYIERLPPGVATALVFALWNINIDFFVRAAGSLVFVLLETPAANPQPIESGNGRTSSTT